MAWQVPPLGQWNPGIPPDMNMGSYVPDQWAVMQQQNWQQWAQWQQQYAQWQNQYGEKYTEQMQAIQAMGGMPPLPPPTAPPPAPPPPEQPPPLPHENNQPLFGNSATPIQPAPVPPPTVKQPHSDNTANLDKMNTQQGNSLNWSYPKENNQQQQVTINAEALKKLAEEERLFDIQFQKWEEEIKKWKSENVNHPDKQAYQEYEQKFEACRAQLMERRQQMKLKRARLTGAPPPPMNANSSPVGNIPPAIPPPKTTSSNTFMNIQSQQYPQKSSDNGGNVQYQRQQYQSNTIGNKSSNINTESQDRYESYQNSSENKCPVVTNPNFSAPDNATFLAKSNSAKGIPGLDLVHEPEKQHGKANENNDVIDITEEKTDIQKQQQGPDYSTISKGINNILGDEKIMNILSMVREQYSKEINVPNVAAQNTQYVGNNWNNPPYSQSNRMPNYNNNNQQYDNRQNDMLCNNRQNLNYPEQKNDNKCPPQNRMYGEAQNQALQDQYGHDENQQYRGQNMPMSHNNVQARPTPPARTNMPAGRPPPQPLLEIPCPRPNQKNVNEYPHNLYERTPLSDSKINSNATQATQAARPKWIEEPMFTPALIVEYEHKPLRLKARDFIEPVHLFEYNHKSKDGVEKKVDFEKEADELFTRKPRRLEKEYDGPERFVRDYYSRDYERRIPREDLRDDNRAWVSPRDDYDDRRRFDRYDDRRKDDRGQYTRRDESHRERERDSYRDRSKDVKRDDSRDNKYHSRSRERDTRKRGHSKDSEISNTSLSKKPKDVEKTITPEQPKHVIMIDDILEPPGRDIRPSKIVIILRGPPGSGKSYLAKLIRDREAEYNGTVRIMSIDDYFMLEGEVEERDPSTGKMIKKRTLKYEYDEKSEETYFNSLKRAFKRTLTDGYFSFLILDAVNEGLKSYADIWNFARQNGFQVYICTMELDPQVCFKRNIHNRSLEDIEVLCARFSQTPAHHLQLDATTLLQNAAIPDVHMEDAEDNVVMGDAEELEVETVFTSKWEKMDDAEQLARLDGTSKPLRPSQLSMEDYLQLDDWKPNIAKPGKKTVRWADIEERRKQEKMRAIGFVVGQTDWNRMTDPTMGSSALTQTKYIERNVRRNY